MAGGGNHFNNNNGNNKSDSDDGKENYGEGEENRKVEAEEKEKEKSLLKEQEEVPLPAIDNGSSFISNTENRTFHRERANLKRPRSMRPLEGSCSTTIGSRPRLRSDVPTNITTLMVVQKLVSSLRYITSLKRTRTDDDTEEQRDDRANESTNSGTPQAEVKHDASDENGDAGDTSNSTIDMASKADTSTKTDNKTSDDKGTEVQEDTTNKHISPPGSSSKSLIRHSKRQPQGKNAVEEIHIKKVELGCCEINTTCPSTTPDPMNYNSYVAGQLFACEFCLQFTDNPEYFLLHKGACTQRHPSGVEIYNKDNISVFEIDGTKDKVYCENLCSLSKLFLDLKRKQCEVDAFVFYVLTVNDSKGKHLAGYFSKEKAPLSSNNVSCLLILPHYQRRGLGRFLIDLSYLFSRIVKTPGTPERPLSKLGLLSYQRYWKDIIVQFLYNHLTEDSILIRSLSEETGIDPFDVAVTLQDMNMVKHHKNKVTIVIKHRALLEYMDSLQKKNHIALDEGALTWTAWAQENGKDKDKKSRVLRKDSVHNFTVAKYEEQYFEATQTTSDVAPPPRKKAR